MGLLSGVKDTIAEAAQKERERRAAENGPSKSATSATGDLHMSEENITDRPDSIPRPIINQVVVTDIDISFGSMVWLMIKFSIATIPAAIVICIIYFLGYAFLVGLSKSL